MVPWGRKKVIKVRVSNLSKASRAPTRGVHLILMLLRADMVLVQSLEVLVFLVVSWATNLRRVLRR